MVVGADAASGGGIHAFDRSTGRQRWIYAAGRGVPGAISGVGQSGYAISSEGQVLAVDLGSGALRWSFPLDVWGWLSPAVAAQRVFVGGGDGVLYALNADTGRVEWRSSLGSPIRTSVIAAATGLYVGTNDGTIFQVDPQDGTIQASHKVDAKLGPRDLAVTNGSLLVLLADEAEDYRALVSIDLKLSGVRWREMASTRWSTSRVLVSGRMAVLGSPTGEVVAYCVADGTKAWSRLVVGTVRVIGASEDALYVGTTQGSLYAVAPGGSCKAE